MAKAPESKPEQDEVAELRAEIEKLKDIMRRNGWSVED